MAETLKETQSLKRVAGFVLRISVIVLYVT